jgi:CDP-glucose 4,6-dehydratase
MPDADFWAKQRVLLTGHTGFKGAWLALWLERLGAGVTGLSLPPATTPNLFSLLQPLERLDSLNGDIRDPPTVAAAVAAARPTVVIHMAAQALVRRSYREPVETFATNVMGTACLLDALRAAPDLRAILVVTSDKVYRNDDSGRAFGEADPLGGDDPYSASKAATELVVASWARSFFASRGVAVATARAGNVIGGGDWSEDRLVPDVWRAAEAGELLLLRHPEATRPWQHVLEPLAGYLLYAERLAEKGNEALPAALNFGPVPGEVMTVGAVADALISAMGVTAGRASAAGEQPAEMTHLAIDPGLAARRIGWRPKLTTTEALAWTAEWYGRFRHGETARTLCLRQIDDYETRRRQAP